MTDRFGPSDVSTNGRHLVVDPQGSSDGAPGQVTRSVEERLEDLLQTIRSWDWRRALTESDRPVDYATTATVTSSTISPTAEFGADRASTETELAGPGLPEVSPNDDVQARPMSLTLRPRHAAAESPPIANCDPEPTVADASFGPPSEPERDPTLTTHRQAGLIEVADVALLGGMNASLARVVEAPTSSRPDNDTATLAADRPQFSDPVVVIEAPRATITASATMTAPTEIPAADTEPDASHAEPTERPSDTAEVFFESSTAGSKEGIASAGVDEKLWFGPEPKAEPEPEVWLRPIWSHPTVKLAAFIVVAAVIVLAVVLGIRHFATNSSGSGPSLTATVPASHPAHHAAFIAPIGAAALAQYQGYAAALKNGNETAASGIAKAGTTPTASQLVLVVVAYRTVVNDYNYNLHLIQWPASMESAIAAESGQLGALGNYLQSFASVSPTGVSSWLVQFHALSNTIQTDDNTVRKDLGLPVESAFP